MRLAHHRWSRRFWQIKDLAQLAYSSEIEGVSAGDRLRFWRAYLGPGYRGRAARRSRWELGRNLEEMTEGGLAESAEYRSMQASYQQLSRQIEHGQQILKAKGVAE